MKILVLNPQIGLEHPIAEALRACGVSLMCPANVGEAWQMIQMHESSLDLAVIHREAISNENAGVELIAKLKNAADIGELPIILTSGKWGDDDFIKHQSTQQGVNAYLKWPFSDNDLIKTIEAIFGESLGGRPGEVFNNTPMSLVAADASSAAPSAPAFDDGGLGIQVEDSASVYSSPNAGVAASSELSMPSLEAPELVASEAPAAPESMPELPQMGEGFALTPMEGFGESDGSDEEAAAAAGLNINDMGTVVKPMGAFAMEPAESPDKDARSEMPYLYENAPAKPSFNPEAIFAQPIGDAVVPGGAVQSPDVETLKKYLMLREQDVGVLSSQVRSMQERLNALDSQLRDEKARNTELTHLASEQKKRIAEFEREKKLALESLQAELNELRFQDKAKTDKARVMELQVRDATEEMSRLKERVRTDIRKIRSREKELENRLEIVKKDSEALLVARESKIVELKRKLDLLEFNMDLLQDQHAREKELSTQLKERLIKAAQVIRVAGGVLDASPGQDGVRGAGALEAAAAELAGDLMNTAGKKSNDSGKEAS